jgi:hypothetical protein
MFVTNGLYIKIATVAIDGCKAAQLSMQLARPVPIKSLFSFKVEKFNKLQLLYNSDIP